MTRRRTSRAAYKLRDAPTSECPHCGRVTRTTSDGVCADCWAGKGGRPMGWKREPPRGGESLLDDILDFLFPRI
ncbi:MAG: hypothetical protein M3321_12225 [Actinomycetota bacterium]|nr:hypothetical protein [Actinomycetota bacterium]